MNIEKISVYDAKNNRFLHSITFGQFTQIIVFASNASNCDVEIVGDSEVVIRTKTSETKYHIA